MSWLDKWHERQRKLDEAIARAGGRLTLNLGPVEEAVTLAKLGLCLGAPLLTTPPLTEWLYGLQATGASAYYWMAASAFGGSLLAILRAFEIHKTETELGSPST